MRNADGGLMSDTKKHVQRFELMPVFFPAKAARPAVAIAFPSSSNRSPAVMS
jgi:hypothetical protein